MPNKNENVTKVGGTKINITNSMSMPVKLILGGVAAAALVLGGGTVGSAISKVDQDSKLDKILTIVTETQIKIIKVETDIQYIKEDVKQNKEDIRDIIRQK